MTFDEAFERLLGHEGGYVNNPSDQGGETKFGISKRAYPAEDIKNLTVERAKQIYLRDYWGPSGAEAAPDFLKYPLFDLGVNSGPHVAVTMLQRVVGEVQDGSFGPRTLAAVNNLPPLRLLMRLNAARIRLWVRQPSWPEFGKGWMNRLADEMENA